MLPLTVYIVRFYQLILAPPPSFCPQVSPICPFLCAFEWSPHGTTNQMAILFVVDEGEAHAWIGSYR
jgi:hypothetical protein